MAIKHAFTSSKTDGSDATLVRPVDWNADHVGRGSMANMPDGTSGLVLTAQGAGVDPAYAAKGCYEFGAGMPLWQNEADFFHWTTILTGSGSVMGKDYGTLRLGTGSTAGSTAIGRGFGFGWVDYAVMDLQWFTSIYARVSPSGTQQWFKIDSDTSGDPTTYAIGWREDAGALKGIVHDGTALYVIDLGVTLSSGYGYSLFLNFLHGSKVEWYVDGVKKGESINIPTGLKNSSTYCVISAQNNAIASDAQVHIHQHSFVEHTA